MRGFKYISSELHKGRLEALTDGIYAIALTLGVLSIDVSDLPTGTTVANLGNSLIRLEPQIFHYGIAFFILASFWMAHHRQTNYIRSVDEIYIWLSVISLFFVSLVPFSVQLVGDYPASFPAVFIYSLNMFLIGFLNTCGWYHATRDHRLIVDDFPESRVVRSVKKSLTVPLISVFVIIFALFVNPLYSTVFYFLIPAIGFLIVYKEKKGKQE
ncbi:DUF1211 domain-containing protein [Methanoplanus sp. FWC-SCC4]|uniref:DUF1211 domain-containing protein n=1 Tax=Methanochimaera problematica TaxID=2609417 RepID=A0AA97FDN8_9EURY|nr:TMEM175 family protein [Methanoplanus sp. FWC-SCC4]WOF15546.1 DUF1211 domain-containing protein [Methanoplanus sp. FWC-SCC4]